MAETTQSIKLPDFISVRDLAQTMEVSPINVIKQLMSNGIMANINQEIDFDTAAIVAEEMGFTIESATEVAIVEEAAAVVEKAGELAWRKVLAEEDEGNLVPRPPVVTMLGHVDHGKTSLLDVIRRANVQEGEAGGITQHIGAYQATQSGQLITFLDTPGHAAFTSMRARGAQATDIAIMLVAADDGLMPQTREAIDHAQAANVPIIVALNKIDLPNANTPMAMQQLSEYGLIPDEWDGDTMVIPVSAKEKIGIEDLLEAILLVAEDLEPRANPKASPTGTILEARMARGRGPMVTLLVPNGTLKQGDTLIVGEYYGRIKAMYDFTGKKVKAAAPSTPVSVSGLKGIPNAGDQFRVVKDEKTARKEVARIEEENRREIQHGGSATSLEAFFANLQEGESKTLNLIIKADVQGSLEPIVGSLEKLSYDDITVNIIHSSTGNITETDVMLASASQAIIMGFNVGSDAIARSAAASERVDIKRYSIIYKLIEDVDKALKGLLDPVFEEVVIGRAEVRAVFRIRGVGEIAGSYMRTGVAKRNSKARLIRNNKLMHSDKVSSLKHLQDNVREVKTGFEFGVNLANWDDYQEGDIIEFFTTKEIPVD